MASTTRGIVYPTSSENIAPLETHFSALANSVEEALDDIVAGAGATVITGSKSFTGPATTGSSLTTSVTFPTTLTSVPVVVATVRGPSGSAPYICTISGNITTTGFTASIYKVSGSSAESLNLEWMAK